MSGVVRQAWQWVAPNPLSPPTGSAHMSKAAAEPLVEERVRGKTAARDACQAAVAEPHAAHTIGSNGRMNDGNAAAQLAERVKDATAASQSDLGFRRDFLEQYDIQRELGKGANGIVTAVLHKRSGHVFACKSVPKVPASDMTDKKRMGHLEALQREVQVMKALQSCLNVARLEEAFEDDTHVHIVQELCTGGELVHALGQRHYSERTAASYMRAVLKTLAQCHSHNILHRDVKPGNFMLASDIEDAHVKAIDFGLAVPYGTPEDVDNIDMQGTPWFLAPEVLASKWSPKADTWAAGVMCFQLLTGRLPFNDKRNPHNPALSAVLRSIMTDKLDFEKSYWRDISDDAKDFVKALLNRDVDSRLTATEALKHPWLVGDVADRKKGRPLSLNVVQRIQRFGRSGVLNRSILELMAVELAEEDRSPEPSVCKLDEKGRPVMDSPHACAMELVLKYLNLDARSVVTRDDVADGLQRMGYRLQEGELDRLCNTLAGSSDTLSRAAVLASQIDWRYMQRHQKERWLAIARRAFDALDVDADGVVSVDGMLDVLQVKIPADEVQRVYEEVVSSMPLQARARNISFRSFMSMLRQPSNDSLDIYDDRHDGSVSTLKSFTRHGATSATGGLAGSAPSVHLNSVLGGYLSTSPGGVSGFGGDSVQGRSSFAGSCAAEAARLEGSVRRGESSTHRGRELSTVFEKLHA